MLRVGERAGPAGLGAWLGVGAAETVPVVIIGPQHNPTRPVPISASSVLAFSAMGGVPLFGQLCRQGTSQL
jgi:hypothetical protein